MKQEAQQHNHNSFSALPAPQRQLDRLFEEINILCLQGRLFCFDRRRAEEWPSLLTFDRFTRQPVVLLLHPDFGHPHEFTCKVLQAIEKLGIDRKQAADW